MTKGYMDLGAAQGWSARARYLARAALWRGRASKAEFYGFLALASLAAIWTLVFQGSVAVAWVVLPISVYLAAGAATRRIQDAGLAGAVFAIPLLGLLVGAIWLAATSGQGESLTSVAAIWVALLCALAIYALGDLVPSMGSNRFGPPPPWTPARLVHEPDPRDHDLDRVFRRMRRQGRTTLRMVEASEWRWSKLGGLPEIEDHFEWPMDAKNSPMAFVAQLDLKEVRRAGGPNWLSDEGRLYFFHSRHGAGAPDCWSVLRRTDRPVGPLNAAPMGATFKERRVEFAAHRSYPSLDWLGVDIDGCDDQSGKVDRLRGYPEQAFENYRPHHRIGGYPGEIQDEAMAVTCELELRERNPCSPDAHGDRRAMARAASRAWRLLLQIDDDPQLGMCWGDAGRLYYFVREDDAKAGDFTNTWVILQSH